MHDAESCTVANCYRCKIASIQISPYAMPSRLRPQHRPKRVIDSYNRGVVRQGDGTPYHRPDGSVIGLHELTGNHRAIEREIRDRHEAGRAGTTPDQPRERTSVST